MENQGKRMPESRAGWSEGEEGVAPELLAVRSALGSLPKLECSPGFEFRLQRKLQGDEAGVRRAGPARGWALGWAGAGLGVATALAIAFFAFDMNVKNPSGAPDSGVVSNGPHLPVPAEKQVAPPVLDQQTANPQEKLLVDTKKDTTKKPPAGKAEVPENLIHVTGTNSSPNR